MVMPNPKEYTAIHGVLRLLTYLNNYPAEGTGTLFLSEKAKNLMGPKLPQILVEYSTATQLNYLVIIPRNLMWPLQHFSLPYFPSLPFYI